MVTRRPIHGEFCADRLTDFEPVLLVNDQVWERLLAPDYPQRRLVHIHRWNHPDGPGECSRTVTKQEGES